MKAHSLNKLHSKLDTTEEEISNLENRVPETV